MLSKFGFANFGENLSLTLVDAVYDSSRVDYFASHLNALLEAKVKDGVNVTGAMVRVCLMISSG
jgi:beta-glucosidase/6-phospho-beta-glucosidase/beta-galactosidase